MSDLTFLGEELTTVTKSVLEVKPGYTLLVHVRHLVNLRQGGKSATSETQIMKETTNADFNIIEGKEKDPSAKKASESVVVPSKAGRLRDNFERILQFTSAPFSAWKTPFGFQVDSIFQLPTS